jgi:hypothetical protein
MTTAAESEPPPRIAGNGRRSAWIAGLAVAAAWLVVAIALLPHYGPTLDEAVGEIPYGEGLLHACEAPDVTLEETLVHPRAAPARAPHPDFVFDQPWTDVWPFGAFLSALSCRACWTEAGRLGAVEAHHLPVPLLVAPLLVVMVLWSARRIGLLAGLGAALCLLASPRFFADAISNLKDGPEAVLYVLAWLATARAVERATLRAWALAAVLAAAALAQKANALFLAPQGALLLVIVLVAERRAARAGRPPAAPPRRWRSALPFALVVFLATYFALSPQLWSDPIDRVGLMYRHVLETGNRATAGAVQGFEGGEPAGVSFEAAQLVLWTTPPVVLLLALVGLVASRLAARDRLVLLIGVVVPVGRNLLPGSVNFDGVRHFLEFMPCLALLAGAGLDAVTRALVRPLAAARARLASALRFAAAAALLAPAALAVVRTEPNGVVYFNGLVGGLAGAQARGVPDATDYWGNSYWQGLDWIDAHAEPGAALHVAIFAPVVRCVAHYRLRADLRLTNFAAPPSGPLYVMYVTRPAWYDRALRELDRACVPAHEIRVDGGAILRILRFDAGAPARLAGERLRRSLVAQFRGRRIFAWSLRDPEGRGELARIFDERAVAGAPATLERLRRLLPPDLHDGLDEVLLEFEPAR